MQSQSENTNIDKNNWNSNEIKELIEYAQYLQRENEDLRAKFIAMNAKLSNEEAKVRQLQILIQQMTIPYEERN